MALRVKICGVTRPDDARAAVDAGADYVGLNFYAKSPRYLGIHDAAAVRKAIDSRAVAVGVFVNASREYVADRIRALDLGMLQFSGDEPRADRLGFGVPTIRTIRVGVAGACTIDLDGSDYCLVDAQDAARFGGTGKRIALGALAGLDLSRAFVAGGLDPNNVAEVAALHPFGIDTASGVESAPGIKDHEKMRSFIANAKSAG
jgi:phosphoribosylanthranilate isomerase